MTLSYLNNYRTKTLNITTDSKFDLNSFKGTNLIDPSRADNKEAVNVGYFNTRLTSVTQSSAADNSIDESKLISNPIPNVKLKDATIISQKLAVTTIIQVSLQM